jgi:hypothetical protein
MDSGEKGTGGGGKKSEINVC